MKKFMSFAIAIAAVVAAAPSACPVLYIDEPSMSKKLIER